jgi:hypothetical protein
MHFLHRKILGGRGEKTHSSGTNPFSKRYFHSDEKIVMEEILTCDQCDGLEKLV